MVILIAPPSVAFVAYVMMTGGVIDGFGRRLIYTAYILAALVAMQLPKLAKLPFALSWWALSFPLAALAIASFPFARIEATLAHEVIGVVVLLLLILVVAGLVLRTVKAIANHEICHPE